MDVRVEALQKEFFVIDRNDDRDDADTLPALLDLLQCDPSTQSKNVWSSFGQHIIKHLHSP